MSCPLSYKCLGVSCPDEFVGYNVGCRRLCQWHTGMSYGPLGMMHGYGHDMSMPVVTQQNGQVCPSHIINACRQAVSDSAGLGESKSELQHEIDFNSYLKRHIELLQIFTQLQLDLMQDLIVLTDMDCSNTDAVKRFFEQYYWVEGEHGIDLFEKSWKSLPPKRDFQHVKAAVNFAKSIDDVMKQTLFYYLSMNFKATFTHKFKRYYSTN